MVSRKANDTANTQPTLSRFWVSSSARSGPAFLDEIRQILPADLASWRHGQLIGALRRKVADIEQMEKRLGQQETAFLRSDRKD